MIGYRTSYTQVSRRCRYAAVLVLAWACSSAQVFGQEIRSGVDDGTKFSDQTRVVALAFGTRPDVAVWAEGLTAITGSKDVVVIRNQFPTMEELVAFFSLEPEWLFLGGHFDGSVFTNGVSEDVPELGRIAISIYFYADHIVIIRGAERKVLHKDEGFALHRNLKYVFWGGCCAHEQDGKTTNMLNMLSTAETRPVSVGWLNRMGYEVTHAICGGYGNEAPFASEDFFDRLAQRQRRRGLTDRDIIESWMQTSIDTDWGEGYPINDSISVIDTYGDEWVIREGQIVKSFRPWADLGEVGVRERRLARERRLELARLEAEGVASPENAERQTSPVPPN